MASFGRLDGELISVVHGAVRHPQRMKQTRTVQ
jgi:hypothetical protein